MSEVSAIFVVRLWQSDLLALLEVITVVISEVSAIFVVRLLQSDLLSLLEVIAVVIK